MTPRRVRTDLALATATDVGRKLFGWAILAILARSFSKADMGDLFFALTFATMFSMLTELGTNRCLVRRIAQDDSHALDRLSEVLSLRLPALVVGFALLTLIAWTFLRDQLAILLLAGLSSFIGDLYYSFGALFLGLRRLGYRLATGLVDSALLVVLVLIAVRAGWDLRAVLLCYVIANVTMVVATAATVRWGFGRFGLVLDSSRLRDVARESFPFFVLTFLGLLYQKIDTVMLRFMKSAVDVAQYEAAYKFLEVSRFAVRPVGMVFFPICAQLVARHDRRAFLGLSRKLAIGAGGVGGLAAAAVIALAGFVVPFVWGSDYGTSIPILRVLFLGVPFLYMSFVGTFLAQALRLERAVVRLMVLSLAGNVLLNAAVIPRWGALGAAWTTVVGEVVLATALTWLTLRGVRRWRSS